MTTAMLEEGENGSDRPPVDVLGAALMIAGADLTSLVESLSAMGFLRRPIADSGKD